MSLIPSESLNFPDSFRANVGWHLSDPDAKPKPRTRRRPTSTTEEQEPKSAEPPLKTEVTAKPARSSNAEQSPASPPPKKVKTAVKSEPAEPPAEPEVSPMSNTDSDAGVATAGPVLTGNDAAAFLSRIFLSASAAAASVEAVNGETAPTNSTSVPTHPASAMTSADADCAAPLHALAAKGAAASEKLASSQKLTTEPAVEHTALSSITAAKPTALDQKPAENASAPANSANVKPIAVPPVALEVENPAQTQHAFELIAAAVQRGTLAGNSISPPTIEPVEPPDTPSTAPSEKLPASIPEAMAAPATPAAPKTPAKIRIQPRKIKPRPVVTTSSQSVVAEEASFNATAPAPAIEKVSMPTQMTFQPEKPAPRFEEPVRRLDYRELAARNIPVATGLEMTRSERRNRWIGFGLSEAAAFTSLVLLTGYGFTHKFPDPTLKILIFILMFAAAAVSVALPIAFIRNSPARWQKRALNYRRDTAVTP